MRKLLNHFARDSRATSAAEFALVLPVLLLFLMGMLDIGRLMWTWNRAEKATQVGVRFAVSTDMVPTGLASYSFTTSGGISQGDPIPESSFGGASCTSSAGTASCTCDSGATCPTLTPVSQTAFTNIVTRMQRFMPNITASNVQVDYDYSGLGYAGDPNGSDVSPMVRVKLRSLAFRPITFMLVNRTITLPDFSAALTMEDGSGTVAN